MKPPMVPHNTNVDSSLREHLDQLGKTLRKITFGSTMNNNDAEINIDHWKASGTTPGVANTEFAVSHGLGRVPLTMAGWDTNNGGVLYRGVTPWTSTQVFLKCTTATAAYNLILI